MEAYNSVPTVTCERFYKDGIGHGLKHRRLLPVNYRIAECVEC